MLDRRASGYEGVIEAIDSKELHLDHERLRRTVPLSILHLAGVRTARDAQDPRPPLPSRPFVKLHTRDGSVLVTMSSGSFEGMPYKLMAALKG